MTETAERPDVEGLLKLAKVDIELPMPKMFPSETIAALCRYIHVLEGQDDGPGDMVCKAHDVSGCAECWEDELRDDD
jgi:hypothetical protein